MSRFKYPLAREDDIRNLYHGIEIKDPYQWMENPENPDVKKFVEDQNKISRPYLDGCPDKEAIVTTLKTMWNYPKYSCPHKYGDKYYFYKNTGLQNQNILYVQDSLTDEARVFLDPNKLSDDGTVALSTSKFSEDGKTFAFSLSVSGSDWVKIHFRNVETGSDYPEILTKVKYTSIAWTHDNKGIFYGRYDDVFNDVTGKDVNQHYNQKLYYHVVGTDQSEDILITEFPEEPELRIGAEVSDCGKWLILTPIKDCKNNLIYIGNLAEIEKISEKIPLMPVVEKLEADYEYITNVGNSAVFRTNKNAPNYRLILIDLLNSNEENWKTLIEETANDVLDWASAVHQDKLVVCYIQDVKNILCLHDLYTGNKLYTFPLDMGTITGFSGEKKFSEFFYFFTSFVNPGVIYRVNLSENSYTPTVFRQIAIPNFDSNTFETRQIFYPSKDGTKISMFLVNKAGSKSDSSRPCLLYGYGGFNVSMQPTFSVMRIIFINNFNGLLAIPNIRGGGEYGEKWHNGGRFFNKQNVFDDFQYAAKYLIANNLTSSEKLVIQGGSNGGLLVAACINQNPSLFRAAISQVGVLDMLRYHKFTIGYAWVSDYGSSDDEKHFHNLLSYSPLHNVKVHDDCQYPATLLLTADHDDRVVPSHSLKFIATLQRIVGQHPNQKNPLLIRIETKAGHGSGKPITKVIDEAVDILCFIALSLDLKFTTN